MKNIYSMLVGGKMKYIIIENKNDLKEIKDILVGKIGLPSIQRRINFYSVNDDLQVEIVNNRISFRESNQNKFTYVKNKNVKHFLKLIHSKYPDGFYINDIVMLDFRKARILFDTFHGDLLTTDDEELLDVISKKFKLRIYENINEHKKISMIQKEFLFDELGNLNPKIRKYSANTGIDIRSVSASIRVRMSNLSNDYSFIEDYYKFVTNTDLLSIKSNTNGMAKFENMSVIIPAYNQSVIATLLSIQGQNLSKEEKQKIQVIVVNDGSKLPVFDGLENVRKQLDFELNVINFENNMGISNARNVGLVVAKYDLLLFMDSDIILSKDYMRDINIRLQIVPNAIFVAMRKNIDKTSPILVKSNLLKGIEHSFDLDDSRVITTSKEYHIGWDKIFMGEKIAVLDDTNYFKELGFGAKVGIYSLATVVTGHNMAVNRSIITKYPVFSNRFRGWGMEDAYFASSLISKGCFVIPILSSCVYHINHPPRSGSMEQKAKEAKANYELYNQMLDEEWSD